MLFSYTHTKIKLVVYALIPNLKTLFLLRFLISDGMANSINTKLMFKVV